MHHVVSLVRPFAVEILIISRRRRARRGELAGLAVIFKKIRGMYVYAVQASLVAKIDRQGNGFNAVSLQQLLVQIAGAVRNYLHSIAHGNSSSVLRPRAPLLQPRRRKRTERLGSVYHFFRLNSMISGTSEKRTRPAPLRRTPENGAHTAPVSPQTDSIPGGSADPNIFLKLFTVSLLFYGFQVCYDYGYEWPSPRKPAGGPAKLIQEAFVC